MRVIGQQPGRTGTANPCATCPAEPEAMESTLAARRAGQARETGAVGTIVALLPAHNEAESIGTTLSALAAQTSGLAR